MLPRRSICQSVEEEREVGADGRLVGAEGRPLNGQLEPRAGHAKSGLVKSLSRSKMSSDRLSRKVGGH